MIQTETEPHIDHPHHIDARQRADGKEDGIDGKIDEAYSEAITCLGNSFLPDEEHPVLQGKKKKKGDLFISVT